MANNLPPSPPPPPPIPLGSVWEITGVDEGFEGSLYQVKVLRAMRNDQYKVEYLTLKEEDGEFCSEIVGRDRLRPVPSSNESRVWGLDIGSRVDAYDAEGWWTGTVISFPDFMARVRLDVNVELDKDISELRMHQLCHNNKLVPLDP